MQDLFRGSRDLTLSNFYIWGFKSFVYDVAPGPNAEEVGKRIINAVDQIKSLSKE